MGWRVDRPVYCRIASFRLAERSDRRDQLETWLGPIGVEVDRATVGVRGRTDRPPAVTFEQVAVVVEEARVLKFLAKGRLTQALCLNEVGLRRPVPRTGPTSVLVQVAVGLERGCGGIRGTY